MAFVAFVIMLFCAIGTWSSYSLARDDRSFVPEFWYVATVLNLIGTIAWAYVFLVTQL